MENIPVDFKDPTDEFEVRDEPTLAQELADLEREAEDAYENFQNDWTALMNVTSDIKASRAKVDECEEKLLKFKMENNL